MKDKIVIAGYGAVGQAHEYLLERFNFKIQVVDPNYYKNAVTTGNPIYNGVSGIYGPYDPPVPDPPELDVEQPEYTKK